MSRKVVIELRSSREGKPIRRIEECWYVDVIGTIKMSKRGIGDSTDYIVDAILLCCAIRC